MSNDRYKMRGDGQGLLEALQDRLTARVGVDVPLGVAVEFALINALLASPVVLQQTPQAVNHAVDEEEDDYLEQGPDPYPGPQWDSLDHPEDPEPAPSAPEDLFEDCGLEDL